MVYCYDTRFLVIVREFTSISLLLVNFWLAAGVHALKFIYIDNNGVQDQVGLQPGLGR